MKIERRISEANVQAEFYHQCKLHRIKCRLEYKYENCRFDCVLYDKNKNVYAIIEIKNRKRKFAPNVNGKQATKYKRFNIPIIYILNYDAIPYAISYLLQKREILPLKFIVFENDSIRKYKF